MHTEIPRETRVQRGLRLGVSSCLAGEAVRYDGGDRRDDYVTGTLARCFELIPVCPEVGIGLGVPRPPIRLVVEHGAARAVGVTEPDRDYSAALAAFSERTAAQLKEIRGYVFKSRSPSCGVDDAPVYPADGSQPVPGSGLFARGLMQHLPLLPVTDETRLAQREERATFLTLVFVYHRWRRCMEPGYTTAGLARFHARHRLLLDAYATDKQAGLARLAARGTGESARRYIQALMELLRQPAPRTGHLRVISSIADRLSGALSPRERADLYAAVAACHDDHAPLGVALASLRHYLARYPDRLPGQHYYLVPEPEARLLERDMLP